MLTAITNCNCTCRQLLDMTVHGLQTYRENLILLPQGASFLKCCWLSGPACKYMELIRLHISCGIAFFVGQPAMLAGLPPCNMCTEKWFIHFAVLPNSEAKHETRL